MSNTILYGRVVRDIECRYSTSRKAFAKFSIAINRNTQQIPPPAPNDGFMPIPDGIDEGLPFN